MIANFGRNDVGPEGVAKIPNDKNGVALGLRANSVNGSGELDGTVYVGDSLQEPEDNVFKLCIRQRRESSVVSNIRKDEERLLGSFLRSLVDGDSGEG